MATGQPTPPASLTNALGQPLTIDPAPLELKPHLSLSQGVLAMAAAAKTYALVVQEGRVLMGVLTYANVATATVYATPFDQSSLADWMTPLSSLGPRPDLHPVDGPPNPLACAPPYRAIVNGAGHWVGIITPEGICGLLESSESSACTVELNACQMQAVSLQEQQERLSLALKGAQMGTLDWDIRADMLVISEELQQLLALPPGEYDGHYQAIFKHIHPEDQRRVDRILQAATQHPQRCDIEFRILLPDGVVLFRTG